MGRITKSASGEFSGCLDLVHRMSYRKLDRAHNGWSVNRAASSKHRASFASALCKN